MSIRPATREEIAQSAIEAARWAPSVHNTQPWWFGSKERAGDLVISLHADPDRRLTVADPAGREMLVSCGAALFSLRLAVEVAGHRPEVTLLPDPDRPNLIADVRIGMTDFSGSEYQRLFEQIERRRSHRGPFLPDPLGAPVLSALKGEAGREGARMHLAVSHDRAALGALTEAAEQVLRMDPAYISEIARWSPDPASSRHDGVHPSAYPSSPSQTQPHYPMRDFAHGQGWGVAVEPGGLEDGTTGVVALLTTVGDERRDWLTAGQALQRMLLRATVEGVSAAFHTQALEVPELRAFVRDRFCGGAYPQVLLRLGYTDATLGTVRRPPEHVVHQEFS